MGNSLTLNDTDNLKDKLKPKQVKVLIVDVGNIYYNNSTISLGHDEAMTLAEVHKFLFQKGHIQDL